MIEFTVPTWAGIVSSIKKQYIYIRLFNLFLAKVSDILLDPHHGLQMQRTQLQLRLQELSKVYKNNFA